MINFHLVVHLCSLVSGSGLKEAVTLTITVFLVKDNDNNSVLKYSYTRTLN